MLTRTVSVTIIILCLITIASLFAIKYEATNLRYQLNMVNNQITHEQDNIRQLKVDIAYLKSPKRLKMLATTYLALEPIKAEQMTSNPATIIADKIPNTKSTQEKKLARNTKSQWRYKKSHSAIQTVATHSR